MQQLSAERGPITSHIEGLSATSPPCKEELGEEFEKKKGDKIEKEKNEQRNALVLADLNHERLKNRKRERFVAAFKRELGNIVSAMVSGKELEDSVRLLYRKFVKGDVIADSTIKAASRPSTRSRIYSLTMTISRQRPPWAVLATKNSLVGC